MPANIPHFGFIPPIVLTLSTTNDLFESLCGGAGVVYSQNSQLQKLCDMRGMIACMCWRWRIWTNGILDEVGRGSGGFGGTAHNFYTILWAGNSKITKQAFKPELFSVASVEPLYIKESFIKLKLLLLRDTWCLPLHIWSDDGMPIGVAVPVTVLGSIFLWIFVEFLVKRLCKTSGSPAKMKLMLALVMSQNIKILGGQL